MCNVYKLENIRKKINIKGLMREDEPLKRHNTFRTGGPADLYIEPSGPEELLKVLRVLQEEGIPRFILGGGANILVSDRGFRGAVIHTGRLKRITLNGNILVLEAGLPVADASLKAGRWGLEGLEYLSAMPGTVGGALWMNARCYNGEISHNFLWADIINEKLEIERIPFRKEEWDYKKSPFQNRNCVILAGAFAMKRGDRHQLLCRMEQIEQDRRAKGHFKAPCAGSTFKNNRAFGAPSGVLIEQAGLKGLRIGGAAVSDWHGNILINSDNASSDDIAALIELVRQKVQETSGCLLEPEVIKIGDWN